MKRFKARTAIFFFLLPVVLPAACGSNSLSVPVNDWKILYDNDESIETVSKNKNWAPVADLSSIKMPCNQGNEYGYIWLRGIFFINESPVDYYGLSAGSIRFTDKTYINKSLVGSQLPEEINWSPKPRNYRIQENILNKGENQIYIRLGVYGNAPGGIAENILILTKNDFSRVSFLNNFSYNQFPFAIMFLHICLSIQFFIFFLWENREKHYLYTSLSLLTAALYVFLFLPSYVQISFQLSYSIKFLCAVVISIFIMLNFQSLYRIFLSDFNRIVLPLLLAAALAISVLNLQLYSPAAINLLLALICIILASAFSFLIYRLNFINQSNQKKSDIFLRNMIITTVIIFGLIIILESYIFLSGGYYPGSISIPVSPCLIIFYQAIVSMESRKRRMELELLYSKLKKGSSYGEYNENDISPAGIPQLTDASERKLKKVIEFIDENYISDLSREGLAAAVDMHPNYMGKLFKTYTGRTINEYINHLRVKEAIRQLESTDSRIIDIAFSMGFESLVTFNRVFKKETGKIPSTYKKSDQA